MRLSLCAFGLSVLVAALSDARAEAPDLVVAYDRPPPTFGAPGKEVLRQHGEQIRIDSQSEIGRTGVLLLRQKFTRPGQVVRFEVGRFVDGSRAFLTLMDDPFSAPPPSTLRDFTGESQTLLGERCRVWEVARPTKHQTPFVQSGCATADGVELWRRQSHVDAIFATKVTRQPVTPDEVRAPTELLDLTNWATPARAVDHSHDYEVALEPTYQNGPHRAARRSGDWTSVREEETGHSYLAVTNTVEGIGLHYTRNEGGERSLNIYKRPLGWAPSRIPTGLGVRIQDRGDEIILGEPCQWWEMMPGVADAGRHECLTPDGVALKVEYISWGHVATAVAVRLKRGRQPLSAVMPGHDLVSARAWGF